MVVTEIVKRVSRDDVRCEKETCDVVRRDNGVLRAWPGNHQRPAGHAGSRGRDRC